ncbi:DNA topoisomerase VI, partial [Thermococci archaeon]
MLKREKPKERFSYDPKKVLQQLERFGKKVLEEIAVGRNPFIDVPTRGLSNVYFDERDRLIKMGDKTSR